MYRSLAKGLVSVLMLLAAGLVLANGTFESITGDVRVNEATGSVNQRFTPGSTITTGPKSQAILRMVDGAAVVLHENTEFRVDQYTFNRAQPEGDNVAVQLIKGAMRSLTGLIGSRNRTKVATVLPQSTIGIRGTDFMAVLVNPAYLSVLQGSIDATNAAGTAVFGAGETATVASASSLAVSIPASALPATVQQIFNELAAVPVTAQVSAADAAQGGLSSLAIPAAAAIAAGIVAAGSQSNSSGPSSPSGTTATTGTTGTTGTL